MRLVIQRVKSASVTVSGSSRSVGKISEGYLILVGVTGEDSVDSADYLASKVAKLRIMSDEEGKMNLSLLDVGASVLAISQFTLYANMTKGNRPSFVKAGGPQMAKKLYGVFIEKLRDRNINVETGEFGKHMMISTELDGPVTITMDK